MKSPYIFVMILLCVCSTHADLGLESSGVVINERQFECLYNKYGFDNLMTSVYDPAGFVDETGITNINNAIDGLGDGLKFRTVSMTPCLANCQNNLTSGVDQANAVINRLNKADIVGMIYVKIDKSQPWSSNQQQNQKFIIDILSTILLVLDSTGGNYTYYPGIITNYNSWSSVVGAKFTEASYLASSLWWVNWNGKQDLTTGFTPFGGWSQPMVHQYAGNIINNDCATGINFNYFYTSSDNFLANKNIKKRKKEHYATKTHQKQ
uniref:Lysozyme n=1 Tax=Acrobeloides nanus TaxID=290746 RepID=A0A914EB46_9BILA